MQSRGGAWRRKIEKRRRVVRRDAAGKVSKRLGLMRDMSDINDQQARSERCAQREGAQ